MKNKQNALVASGAVALALCAGAVPGALSEQAAKTHRFTVKADRIAVDNVSKSAVLTGHVEAVSGPIHLTTDMATRAPDGVMRLHEPTSITSCTNHPGICHWRLRGDVEYLDGKYIKGRDVWLEFYELPIFWLPYFYYPLEGDCAFRIMPGYTSRWGAYLLTKTVYNIIGDPTWGDDTWWLHGNTRFDLRYRNGIALGETLYWNFGDFGKGKFKIYYAWDQNSDRYDVGKSVQSLTRYNWNNWGSVVNRDRYAIEFLHRWDITERDVFRVQGAVFSDSYFRSDFFRDGFFMIESKWVGYDGNEVTWEHNENGYGAGVSVSGPLNEFYGGTAQLPEVYIDVQPQPILSWPVNYESQNRLGYLSRSAGEYGATGLRNPYAFNPGRWADYEAFRVDSYHRFTAPFRTLDDLMSVVPRFALRGTGWSNSGNTDLEGWNRADSGANAFRTIMEVGSTFAGRGQAWYGEDWRHTIEPYLDFLAQKAWYAGMHGSDRPYIFDSYDASVAWEDQFAGRSRNLPYTYCGITPGLRNALSLADERGVVREIFDFDVYAALQFNSADYFGEDDYHRLAEAGSPNYGKNSPYVSPGFRTRWKPDDDISLSARLEYDSDNNKLALGDFSWNQKVTKDFSYFLTYSLRDYRWWDYSSTPYDPSLMRNDDLNCAHFQYVRVGFTQQPISWFAWSPFIRWDIKENELDSVGTWFDYLTDCLGFRLVLSYDNEYTRIDGFHRDQDWDIGFFIYLRALGPEATNFTEQ